MKSAALMFMALIIIAAVSGFFCSIYISNNKKADNAPVYDISLGKCIVTSSPLEKGRTVVVTFKGREYILCCIACKSVFEKNPNKFIRERKNSGINAFRQRYPNLFNRSKL